MGLASSLDSFEATLQDAAGLSSEGPFDVNDAETATSPVSQTGVTLRRQSDGPASRLKTSAPDADTALWAAAGLGFAAPPLATPSAACVESETQHQATRIEAAGRNQTAAAADTAASSSTRGPASAAPLPATQAWNLGELSHQFSWALRDALTARFAAEANSPAAPATPAAPIASGAYELGIALVPDAKAAAAPLASRLSPRPAYTKTALAAYGFVRGDPTAGGTRPDIQTPAAEPANGVQPPGAAENSTYGPTPADRVEMQAAGTIAPHDAPATDGAEAAQARIAAILPGAASASAVPANTLEWTARPVETATGSHLPGLIEQVRQAAEFMAERSEGAIRAHDGGVEANLRLYPPDLGGVRVSINVQGDQVTQAVFVAEQPETARLLDQNIREFREALGRHGLTVGRIDVTVAAGPVAAASGGTAPQFQNPPQQREAGGNLNERRPDAGGQERSAGENRREQSPRERRGSAA
ncbi:MAG: flagellar hook-length control protein FliK [bacterium]|nr:flagellar hook-length control protein FliK [bacterium]